MTQPSHQQLDRFVQSVAKTRRRISHHFFENLQMPAAPCLDILLALHAVDGGPLDTGSISEYIFSTDSVTHRYLNLMISEELIEVEKEMVRLTPKGANELSSILSQFHEEYNEQGW